jgi:probable F420-dependent oxidoreductase
MPRRHALSLELPGLTLPQHEPVVRAAEAAGYTDAWSGETGGHDGFTSLVLAAAWTERMRLGTGVVNVFTRGPAVLAQQASALQDASEGRFCLGIGSSSNVIVERWNGIPFEKPRTRVRETVEFLRKALAGERAGDGGFKLEQPPPSPVPIYVAALREKMLQTAGEIGDGAWINFTPLASLEKVMGAIREGEHAAGKDEGSVDVCCRFFCIQGDKEQALGLASFLFAGYATVPVYEQYFRWLGYGDAIDPLVEAWRAKDRKKAVELAPRDLIEDIFILGDADEQRARLDQYAEGGVSTPVLQLIPLGAEPSQDLYVSLAESLAPAS